MRLSDSFKGNTLSVVMQGLALIGLAGAGVLCGCMGAASSSTTAAVITPATSSTAAPAVVTVSDAPLSNILSAVVTISSVNLSAGGSATPVSLLSKPVTVELSGLGAVQEPIELTTIPMGTYSSASLTVTAAQVTYLNALGQATTATATLSQPTLTVALAPALTVATLDEIQLQLAFNLAQSFSITGTAVTFTPAINTAAAQVSMENTNDRQVEVTGQAISVSATSITIQSGDSGRQFTFAINSATQFAGGTTAAAIQQGSIVQVQGQTQTDGSLVALTITQESQGKGDNGQEDGAKGIVVSVTTGSNGAVTGFSMVPRESFGNGGSANGGAVAVTLSPATTYGVSEDAVNGGVAASAFNAAEIFPGQSVLVTGSAATTSGSAVISAAQVTLAAESLSGALTAVPQATSAGFGFQVTLPTTSYLTMYLNVAALNVSTNAMTEFGDGLSAAMFGSTAAGTNVEVHGYLLRDAGGNLVLFSTQVKQVKPPETPEGGTDN